MPTISLLLYDLLSPINIGMCLRLAETFGVTPVIFDPSGVMANPDKRRTVSDFSCGALERAGYRSLSDIGSPPADVPWQRLIASSITPPCASLDEVVFADGDVLLVGNEFEGLPDSVVRSAHLSLRIPMADVWTPKPISSSPIDAMRAQRVRNDGSPSLNVAVAAGILCYSAFLSLKASNTQHDAGRVRTREGMAR